MRPNLSLLSLHADSADAGAFTRGAKRRRAGDNIRRLNARRFPSNLTRPEKLRRSLSWPAPGSRRAPQFEWPSTLRFAFYLPNSSVSQIDTLGNLPTRAELAQKLRNSILTEENVRNGVQAELVCPELWLRRSAEAIDPYHPEEGPAAGDLGAPCVACFDSQHNNKLVGLMMLLPQPVEAWLEKMVILRERELLDDGGSTIECVENEPEVNADPKLWRYCLHYENGTSLHVEYVCTNNADKEKGEPGHIPGILGGMQRTLERMLFLGWIQPLIARLNGDPEVSHSEATQWALDNTVLELQATNQEYVEFVYHAMEYRSEPGRYTSMMYKIASDWFDFRTV